MEMRKILYCLGALLLIIILSSGTLLKDVDRKVICPTSLQQAQKQLTEHFNQGYRIESITSENVATAVNSRTNTQNAYDSPYRDLRGGFLIVLIRYK